MNEIEMSMIVVKNLEPYMMDIEASQFDTEYLGLKKFVKEIEHSWPWMTMRQFSSSIDQLSKTR